MNIKKIANLPKHKRYKMYEELYLEYANNYLTVSVFAEDYGIDKDTAISLIDAGRIINQSDTPLYY